jgi:hypothetical protein
LLLSIKLHEAKRNGEVLSAWRIGRYEGMLQTALTPGVTTYTAVRYNKKKCNRPKKSTGRDEKRLHYCGLEQEEDTQPVREILCSTKDSSHTQTTCNCTYIPTKASGYLACESAAVLVASQGDWLYV